MNDLPFVSVIIPVRNGEGRIERLFESLAGQTYPKNLFEVIVADGRSTDRTAEIAKNFGAKVIDNHKLVQGAGRNMAVKEARGELVAFSEDDCVVPPDWLRIGVSYLENQEITGVGGPTPLPESAGCFAKASNVIFTMASMAGYSVQSEFGRAREAEDLPGGNAMYRKNVLERFLPIREGLAEDVDLNLRMRKEKARLLYAPDFMAWHYKRETPGGFYRQIRRFGIGRRRLGRDIPEAVRPLHWVTALAAPAGLVASALCCVYGCFLYLAAAVAMALLSLVIRTMIAGEPFGVAVRAPFAAIIFFIAWSVGFLTETMFPGKAKP